MRRSSRCHRLIATTILACCVATVAAASNEETLVYRRADLREVVEGEATLRRAYTKRLTLPQFECPEERFFCDADVTYGQVYAITFTLLEGTRDIEGLASWTRSSRGELLIAIDLSVGDEQQLEQRIDEVLTGLSVPDYYKPQAGIGWYREPVSQEMMLASAQPFWLCATLDDSARCDMLIQKENGWTSTGPPPAKSEVVARELRAAVDGLPVESYRAIPEVRRLLTTEVRVTTVSTLGRLRWSDPLIDLPETVSFEKRVLDGKKTGGMRDRKDGAYRGHEGRYNDIERSVLIPPANLDLAEAPMVVQRWAFHRVEETFGEAARRDDAGRSRLDVAVLPIRDRAFAIEQLDTEPVEPPIETLNANALKLFRTADVVDPVSVRIAFAGASVWPAKGDWLIVICDDSGSAKYGIAPFGAVAEIENPREACDAIAREVSAAN